MEQTVVELIKELKEEHKTISDFIDGKSELGINEFKIFTRQHFIKEDFKLFPKSYMKTFNTNIEFKRFIVISYRYIDALDNGKKDEISDLTNKLKERIEYEENVIFKLFD